MSVRTDEKVLSLRYFWPFEQDSMGEPMTQLTIKLNSRNAHRN